MDSAAAPPSPRSQPTLLIGDGTMHLPERQAFIGRRREMRQYLRAFLEGETRGLLFMGPGGVGKTTLAGLFARALGERYPETRLLGFRAPFMLDTLYEPLRREAFDGMEEPSLLAAIQAEPDLRERLRRLLQSLAQRRGRPCAFVLDNLEAIQDLASLKVAAEHADSLWFLREVCALPAPTRVLLTGRYAIGDLPDGVVRVSGARCTYGECAPYAAARLAADHVGSEKRQMYSVLGGNHRAIEWAAQVLKQEHQQTAELVAALSALHAPPETPEEVGQVVVEAMRQNLLFARLRSLLTSTQDRLLRAASLYRVPVNEDGLLALTDQPAQPPRIGSVWRHTPCWNGDTIPSSPWTIGLCHQWCESYCTSTASAHRSCRHCIEPWGATIVFRGNTSPAAGANMSKPSTTSARRGNTLPPMRWLRGSALLLPHQQLHRCQRSDRGDRAACLATPSLVGVESLWYVSVGSGLS